MAAPTTNDRRGLASVPPPAYQRDRLSFRTEEEVLVYERLCEIQRSLPPTRTIMIVPIPSLRVRDHTWEVDFLVTYSGKVAVIEVDGGVHHGRWAADRSRDRLLEDGGAAYVERIPVEDVQHPDELDRCLKRLLERLLL